jgi:hypothetical protein
VKLDGSTAAVQAVQRTDTQGHTSSQEAGIDSGAKDVAPDTLIAPGTHVPAGIMGVSRSGTFSTIKQDPALVWPTETKRKTGHLNIVPLTDSEDGDPALTLREDAKQSATASANGWTGRGWSTSRAISPTNYKQHDTARTTDFIDTIQVMELLDVTFSDLPAGVDRPQLSRWNMESLPPDGRSQPGPMSQTNHANSPGRDQSSSRSRSLPAREAADRYKEGDDPGEKKTEVASATGGASKEDDRMRIEVGSTRSTLKKGDTGRATARGEGNTQPSTLVNEGWDEIGATVKPKKPSAGETQTKDRSRPSGEMQGSPQSITGRHVSLRSSSQRDVGKTSDEPR